MPPQPVLIFANGTFNDGWFVQQALHGQPAPFVIAADGGARHARQAGKSPQLVIGDMDSLTEDELQALADDGAAIQRFPAEKNETDLELALHHAHERGADCIRIIGATGRRIDQTFGNVYLLALPALRNCDVRLVTGDQQLWLARPGTHTIHGEEGDTLSLLPFSAEATGITTDNLYYPLHDATLTLGPARGMSNVLDGGPGHGDAGRRDVIGYPHTRDARMSDIRVFKRDEHGTLFCIMTGRWWSGARTMFACGRFLTTRTASLWGTG